MSTWQQLPPLRAGDRIGIVAPGGALSRADFEAGLVPLRAMGLEPVYDANVFAREGYFAGPDALRAQQLAQVLGDASLRAIWAARGRLRHGTHLLPGRGCGRGGAGGQVARLVSLTSRPCTAPGRRPA